MPKLAIVATVKDEGPYLLEWIAYHRALGIRIFFIADNGGSDNTSKVLQDLHEREIIYRFDRRGHAKVQMQFYYDALAQAVYFNLDGLFVLDADEFLRPEHGTSIWDITTHWLADPALGAVAMNMAIYGSSGHEQMSSGLVIERFTRRAEREFRPHRLCKSFVRVNSCKGFHSPHTATLRERCYVNTRREPVTWTDEGYGFTTEIVWDMLRIDHFMVKSRAEYARKMARGDAFFGDRDYDLYFEPYDRNEVEDPMPEVLIERTRQEMMRLTLLPTKLRPTDAPIGVDADRQGFKAIT